MPAEAWCGRPTFHYAGSCTASTAAVTSRGSRKPVEAGFRMRSVLRGEVDGEFVEGAVPSCAGPAAALFGVGAVGEGEACLAVLVFELDAGHDLVVEAHLGVGARLEREEFGFDEFEDLVVEVELMTRSGLNHAEGDAAADPGL